MIDVDDDIYVYVNFYFYIAMSVKLSICIYIYIKSPKLSRPSGSRLGPLIRFRLFSAVSLLF